MTVKFTIVQIGSVLFPLLWEVGDRGFCSDLCQSVLPVFLQKFIASHIIFRSLIQFIFVNGVRECSNLIHAVVQFYQHYLLRRLSFSIVYYCLFYVGQLTIGVWLYFGAFYSIPLIYMSVFVPVPNCLDYCNFVV